MINANNQASRGAVGYKGAINFVLGRKVNEETVKVILKDQLK